MNSIANIRPKAKEQRPKEPQPAEPWLDTATIEMLNSLRSLAYWRKAQQRRRGVEVVEVEETER